MIDRIRSSIFGLLVGLLALAPASASCAVGPEGESPAAEEPLWVQAFGCYMKLPAGFVLNSRERESVALYARFGSYARLNISHFGGDDVEGLTLSGSETMGNLVVETFVASGDVVHEELYITRVHDGKQELMIFTERPSLAADLVLSCSRDPVKKLH